LRQDLAAGTVNFDAIVGPAMGGIIVAWELGRQLGLPAFFTERDDTGAMALRRGFTVRPGQRVLIAEDVVTTGKSSAESAAVLAALGAEVVTLACIVDRRAENVPVSWPLYAAVRVAVTTWEAGNCPLCARGVPAVKPGSRKIV